MKCLNCPLCGSDWDPYNNDGDIYCLVTGDYADDEHGCTRTNKWILSQNVEEIKKKRLQEEADRWSEYVEAMYKEEKEEEECLESKFLINMK